MTVSPDYIDFIRQLEDYRFWSENRQSRYEALRDGISPGRRYDPHNNKEDKDKLDKAVASHLRYIKAQKNQKK